MRTDKMPEEPESVILKREKDYKDLILVLGSGIKIPEFWLEAEEVGRLHNGKG